MKRLLRVAVRYHELRSLTLWCSSDNLMFVHVLRLDYFIIVFVTCEGALYLCNVIIVTICVSKGIMYLLCGYCDHHLVTDMKWEVCCSADLMKYNTAFL